MPEGLEAEIWRRATESLVTRRIEAVVVDDRYAPTGFADAVVGCRIESARRAGKVVLLDTSGPTIGLHFGMTGRLVIDGVAPIDRLEYSSGADRADWDRFVVATDPAHCEGPAIRLNDPRRLGRVSLDPDLSHLGPDCLEVEASDLAARVARRSAPIKVALLDQSLVAGLGNLCADEVLLWAGIAPMRPAAQLSFDELDRLAVACRTQLPLMLDRGGSTCGALEPALRRSCGPCPLDGVPLARSTIGGRTAIWCPTHQR